VEILERAAADKAADPIPDLIGRDFSAGGIDQRWCGDLTEIGNDEGKLYLATVLASPVDGCPGSPRANTTTRS
jgi:hypothetical protein